MQGSLSTYRGVSSPFSVRKGSRVQSVVVRTAAKEANVSATNGAHHAAVKGTTNLATASVHAGTLLGCLCHACFDEASLLADLKGQWLCGCITPALASKLPRTQMWRHTVCMCERR